VSRVSDQEHRSRVWLDSNARNTRLAANVYVANFRSGSARVSGAAKLRPLYPQELSSLQGSSRRKSDRRL
jgi:hypothetical protein